MSRPSRRVDPAAHEAWLRRTFPIPAMPSWEPDPSLVDWPDDPLADIAAARRIVAQRGRGRT